MRQSILATAFFVVITLANDLRGGEPRFMGLGDLKGGTTASSVEAISADGSTVVGTSHSQQGQEAIRWSRSGGLQALGDLPGGKFKSAARAVSADGTVIVGYGYGESGRSQATRWVDGKMSALPDHSELGSATSATDISGDGQTVIGQVGRFRPQGFAWNQKKGYTLLESTIRLSGKRFKMQSKAMSVSPNGRVVAGHMKTNQIDFVQACVWIDGKGVPIRVQVGRGLQAGFIFTRTTLVDLAMQGKALDAVVGRYQHKNRGGTRGFWKGDNKLKFMESNGRSLYWPIAVSGDGRTVVGRGKIQGKRLACLWKPDGSVQSMEELAAQAGVSIKGWQLSEAVGISADGKVIAGNGTNPQGEKEAWVLALR